MKTCNYKSVVIKPLQLTRYMVMAVFIGLFFSIFHSPNAAVGKAIDYSQYYQMYNGKEKIRDKITLLAKDATLHLANLKTIDNEQSIEMSSGQSAEFAFSAKSSGLCMIAVDYRALGTVAGEYSINLKLNGQNPFFEASRLTLPKIFENKNKNFYEKDDFGNELTPVQVEKLTYQNKFFKDVDGMYAQPYFIYIEQGENVLTFSVEAGAIAIRKIELFYENDIVSYSEYIKEFNGKKSDKSAETIIIQAENMSSKSHASLYPMYDNTSTATSPSNAAKIVLNTVGKLNWQYVGQSITYDFEVAQDGLYKIYMRARQNFKRGVDASRAIYIDDKIPFKELSSFKFKYSDKWYMQELSGEQPYLLYLEKGAHTMTIEVSPIYPDLLREMADAVFSLNKYYRKIIMLTGTNPDSYQDYEIHKKMPDFESSTKELITTLDNVREQMLINGFQKGGEAEILERISSQLQSFLKQPETVPFRMADFQNNISGFASWSASLTSQPLELDYIAVANQEHKIPKANANMFSNIAFTAQRFFASFINDYSKLGKEDTSSEAINVWVGLGRDQVEVVKRLTDDYFSQQYGVKVNVNLVQQGLVPATLTGKGPDVALFVSPNDVVNLAARDALVELSGYKEFSAVSQRFQKEAMLPYEYLEGTYGLPLHENFLMMFYREDIFEQLGIVPPKTWQEFYQVVAVLQRNNLTAGVPAPPPTGLPGGEIMFQNLLFQYGGKYYRGGWQATDFDSIEALTAFTQWTDFFTKYSLPDVFDFYSRFRSGEMPLGIAGYTTYNQFYLAAPEIRGLWKMTPIPGVADESGTINNSTVGMGNGLVMFKNTKNKDGAWDFMNWWTSAKIQALYAAEIETLMGPAARFDTSNKEAFETIPWSNETSKMLIGEWSKMRMAPQTPVNYYITRNLTNAFRRVVYKSQNPREVLSSYNRDINKEIMRRRLEFGLSIEGKDG